MARPPVKPFNTAPFGAYGFVRHTAAEGACGLGQHPCTHWGSDIVAPAGTVVAAPTDGWILVSRDWGNTHPYGGFGPGLVVFAHDDRKWLKDTGQASGLVPKDRDNLDAPFGVTMYYSLLGHINQSYAQNYDPNELEVTNGSKAAKNYEKIGTAPSIQNGALRVKPWPTKYQYVKEGQPLGTVRADMRHVHWSIFRGPIGEFNAEGTYDPGLWLRTYDPGNDYTIAPASPIATGYTGDKGGGGTDVGKLVIGAFLAWGVSKLLEGK